MVQKQKYILDILNTLLSNDILNIIYQYLFHKCFFCKHLTKTFCIYCRKSICGFYYHFIDNGICEMCLVGYIN